jgi:hypothetical protein
MTAYLWRNNTLIPLRPLGIWTGVGLTVFELPGLGNSAFGTTPFGGYDAA